VRVAVCGSHSTGKSTLITAFLARRPDYTSEPEAYEILADDIDFASSDTPTPEGLEVLLQYTVSAVAAYPAGAKVVFERSPADYLAYAAASRRGWDAGAVADFLRQSIPIVRESLNCLDLIVLLPVSRRGPIEARADEDDKFRKRVDRCLRRALVDDDYDLLDGGSPMVSELPPDPDRRLAEMMRLTADPG
jgi:hypothetical protein